MDLDSVTSHLLPIEKAACFSNNKHMRFTNRAKSCSHALGYRDIKLLTFLAHVCVCVCVCACACVCVCVCVCV